MALKEFKRFNSEDTEKNDIQSNVREFLAQLNVEFLDGVLIKDVAINTTKTLVPHKLGRKYQGWVVVNTVTNSNVWVDGTATDDSSKFIPLIASSTSTISLWVF